ncbi:hypothetical protein [Thermobifida cellulosilytica]|uniref:Uncharacterized protein n=1 Tax=Thermobifida cellulosilytica TB100 TaxID=665004 RepID=A0A147KIY4_THECS|nr:hypothetical protein [Thermobifida cellulosilytica]KUP97274.1 hypothetical protein AC529_07815 [Thermobifida cellulosilytica TB100]
MNDHRRTPPRILVADPVRSAQSDKLLSEEMERLGAPSALGAARLAASRDTGDAPALRRLFSRRPRWR